MLNTGKTQKKCKRHTGLGLGTIDIWCVWVCVCLVIVNVIVYVSVSCGAAGLAGNGGVWEREKMTCVFPHTADGAHPPV